MDELGRLASSKKRFCVPTLNVDDHFTYGFPVSLACLRFHDGVNFISQNLVLGEPAFKAISTLFFSFLSLSEYTPQLS